MFPGARVSTVIHCEKSVMQRKEHCVIGVTSLPKVEKHALQFASDLRNRNSFLTATRNLNLQRLNPGQTGTFSLTIARIQHRTDTHSLTINRNFNLHRSNRNSLLTVVPADSTFSLQGIFFLFWSHAYYLGLVKFCR